MAAASHPAPHGTRAAAVHIVRTLRAAGHVAYLAGGCVRDALLGLEPKDCDVATDATPQAVKRLFRGSRFVGEAFGVVLVRTHGAAVEVATFRREWGYTDGRRPSKVEFTSAEEDAQRRDFTINGLFEDPPPPAAESADRREEKGEAALQRRAPQGTGRIIDYVHGRADLAARLIRAIGDPELRFAEDYLRMLRAVRFAAALGFTVEPATALAIRRNARHLTRISRERIGQEVQRMFVQRTGNREQGTAEPKSDEGGRGPVVAATLMQDLHLDALVLDEVHSDAPLHTLGQLAGTSLVPGATYAAVLAAWAIDRHLRLATSADLATVSGTLTQWQRVQAGSLVDRWRKALCLTNDDRDALAGVLGLLPRALTWSGLNKAQRKRLLAHARFPEAFAVLRALGHVPAVDALVTTIANESAPLHREGVAPPPLVTGADLIALGLAPGPMFGRLLQEAYDAQLDGQVATRSQGLEWLRQRAPADTGRAD